MPVRLDAPRLQLTSAPYAPAAAPCFSCATPFRKLTPEEEEEGLHVATLEAKRAARRTPGGMEMRKRVFERVFRHRCQMRGIPIGPLTWKSHQNVSGTEGSEGDVLWAQE